MQPQEILAAFPEQVRASTERPDVLYHKQPASAVHHRPAGTPAPGAAFVLNDGEIAVYPGDAPISELDSPGIAVTPVYGQRSSPVRAVPTGQVFIRFRESVNLDTRRNQIAEAGYEISQSLAYAPHAAWLRAKSGNAADALNHLAQLERLPDVENVEPQMLRERGTRAQPPS